MIETGKYLKTIDMDEVVGFLSTQSPSSRVYVGCDSDVVKINGKLFADYATVVVVHLNGKNGCKIFGEIYREQVFDKKKANPRMRLMNEVYRASAMFCSLVGIVDEQYMSCHLDINANEIHGSNCVINEAIGYIKGTCNVIPLVKPDAWAASTCADYYKKLVNMK